MGIIEKLEEKIQSLEMIQRGHIGRIKELSQLVGSLEQRVENLETNQTVLFDLKMDKENSETTNHPSNYPDYWPIKPDGSELQVGDEVLYYRYENIQSVKKTILEINLKNRTMRFSENRALTYDFGSAMWVKHHQIRLPEDQDFPTSKKKSCTMLLDHIVSRLPKDGVQMEILHDDLKRLRELINE